MVLRDVIFSQAFTAEGARLLHKVDLGAGHSGGSDESAVLGADQRQVALSGIGTVFSSLQFTLESSYSCNALLRYALLGKKQTKMLVISPYIVLISTKIHLIMCWSFRRHIIKGS